MDGRGGTLALAAALLLSGCAGSFFVCGSDDECTGDGDGTCEPSGYCSFPDETCPSGRRYGELAGGPLSGACVEPMDSVGSSGATSTTSATTQSTTLDSTGSTDATTPTTDTPTTASDSTSSTTASSSSSESSSDGSSTGNDPFCGDGLVEAPETCDDGNTEDGDSCNPTCHVPGEVLWSDIVHVGANDRAYTVAAGPDGQIAVGGFVTTEDGIRAFVRVYQDDAEVWSFTADGPQSQAWGLAFTGDGDVLVAGYEDGPSARHPWRARLAAEDGSPMWEHVDLAAGRLWELSPAGEDGFCVGGERVADPLDPLDSYVGCGLASTGQMEMEFVEDIGAGSEDWVEAVTVDGPTVFIGGAGSLDGTGRAGFIRAYDRLTSGLLWSAWIPADGTGRAGIFGLHDTGPALALAGTRNVSGSGWQALYGTVGKDAGDDLAFEEFGGSANDEAFAIVTDPGATFVGGFITNNVTRGYVERVSDPPWTHEVIGNGPGFNRIFALAFTPDGNLVAAGYQSDANDGFDIVTLRLAR